MSIRCYNILKNSPRFFTSASLKADLKSVSLLRTETGLAIQLCRQALEDAGNDIDKARVRLNQLAHGKAEKKISENQESLQEGIIGIFETKEEFNLIRARCRTDFAARSQLMKQLLFKIADAGKSDGSHDDLIKETISAIQEPIIVDEMHKIMKQSSKIYGRYIHGKITADTGSVGAIVTISSPESKVSIPQSIADQIACHVAGLNPKSMEELSSQEYLFAPSPSVSVGTFLNNLHNGLCCESFIRISVK